MMRPSFALVTALLLIFTSLPVVAFGYLKYLGLEDDFGLTYDTDVAESRSCGILFKFGQFEQILNVTKDPEGSICAVFICQASNCGLKIESGQDTLQFASNAEIKQLTVDEFEKFKTDREASLEIRDDPIPDENAPHAVEKSSNKQSDSNTQSDKVLDSLIGGPNAYRYPFWQWLSIFSVAIVFSIVGVSTSLISRKRAVFGLQITSGISSVLVIYFYSIISGLLVVSLFAGGFVQGNLFPNFTGDEANFGFNSWNALKFRGQDWFKLAVWCYISGFYERFVPQILDTLVAKTKSNEATQTGT